MKYYLDIKIKPDAEMRENVLLNKVYTKLHKALFDLRSTDIGISFPRYEIKLGDVIRVHGTEARLTKFQSNNWLGGLSGYCDVSQILAVPTEIQYRTVSRKQSNMTPAKFRRLVKRGTASADDAKAYKAKMFLQGMDLPYLELESSSNSNKHRRYIVFSELKKQSTDGEFDHFGLSKTATIPWF